MEELVNTILFGCGTVLEVGGDSSFLGVASDVVGGG